MVTPRLGRTAMKAKRTCCSAKCPLPMYRYSPLRCPVRRSFGRDEVAGIHNRARVGYNRRCRLLPCRLCRAVHARSAARPRYGSSRQPRSCGLQAPSRAGGRCCRECRGRMRDRGLCKAHVDAVAAAPREHDARRVPGRRICGIRQWPPVLGDGDRRQQSCQYPSAWRHSRSGRPQRQGPRWHCRPGLLHRWKQRAVSGDSYLRTIELSGR